MTDATPELVLGIETPELVLGIETPELVLGIETPELVLGIETSCDETAAAVRRATSRDAVVGRVEPGRPARPFRRRGAGTRGSGAPRALRPGRRRGARGAGATGRAARRSAAVAATAGPGLIGGAASGDRRQGLAMGWGVPFVGVNHLEGHLFAALLEDPAIGPPPVVVLVSGGHSLLV